MHATNALVFLLQKHSFEMISIFKCCFCVIRVELGISYEGADGQYVTREELFVVAESWDSRWGSSYGNKRRAADYILLVQDLGILIQKLN
jgi:hypothetical protein